MSGRSTPFPYGADSQEEADAIARLGLPTTKVPDVEITEIRGNDYRMLRGRMAYVASVDGESLGDHLRRAAANVDMVEAEECIRTDEITEGVSHVVVVWRDDEGWSSLLVIE